MMLKFKTILWVGLLAGISTSAIAAQSPVDFSGHHIYVNSNDKANKIIHYSQLKDGSLLEISRIPTSGEGTGGYKPLTQSPSSADALVSAGAIAISPDNQWLFAVNAGDNSVSSFMIDKNGEPRLVDKKSTLTEGVASTLSYNPENETLYVGHTFGPDHISVFSVSKGKLRLLPGSHTVNTGSATDRILTQVQVDPSNRFLLANVIYDKRPEKINGKFVLTPSNKTTKDGLAVFPILENGDIGKPKFYDAGGETPFGLTFIKGGKGKFINSLDQDPGITILSKINADGSVTNLSSALAKVSTPGKKSIGTCWVSMSPDGQFAFVTGFDTGEVASFSVASDTLTFRKGQQATLKSSDLSNDPAAVATGSPVGSWVAPNGYFYQLYPAAAKLVAYHINGDSLSRIDSYTIPLNSPQGITGF